MKETVGFVGLGAMGAPMALNIQKGIASASLPPLHVWNRTASKAQPVIAEGAVLEPSLESLAASCDIIFAMTFDDNQLRLVHGAIVDAATASSTHKTLVTCSTVAPSLVEKLSSSGLDTNVVLVSMPVFGRPDAAAAKALTAALAGGDSVQQASVMRYAQFTCARIITLDGPAHTANVLKLTGNFCIASVIDMLAQAQTLAEKNGVPRDAVVELVSQLMPGRIVDGYSSRIATEDFEVGFTVDGGLKDVGLMRDLAASSGVSLPFADVVNGHLQRQKEDNKDLDWASIANIIRKDSGI